MKNTFYFFVLFFIAVTALNAQAPANDACSGAQTVTPNGNCYPGTTVGSADNWIGTVGCQSANHVEVWYSFTATGSQLSVSVTPGTIGGTIEFILVQATAPCTGLSIVGSLCGSSPLTGTINGLQAGNLYYYTISSTGSAGTFTTCVNNTSPPPVAGQDCATAAILCSSATFSQSTSAAGFGVQEVSTLNSCWGSGGERQSKWFKFTVGCTGILEFNINPITNSNDYDWALWDVTTAGCPTSTSAIPTSIACNWSGCKGSTGLSSCPNSEPGVVTSGAGCGGGPAAWSTPITVTAGQTYALLVDNFSTSNTGFNLIFGGACNGGTALIGPSAAFTFTSPSCGIFNFSKSCQTTNSTFFWNFGDGTTSTLQNPSHTYTVSGNYIVTLQVTDALGCTVTTSQTMNVGIPISNAGVDQVLCSTAIGSIGTASTSGYTYSWSPSTGLSSTTVSNPSFTLTNTGVSAVVTVYTVTTSSSGCTSTDAVSVTVNPSPTVTAGSTQSITCFNTSTVLTGTSSGGVITWSGPGITGGGSTTTPTVNAAGIYTISVTSAGCTSAATVAVVANTIAPTVTATTSNSLNCSVLTSSVIVSTTTSPASYTWTGTGISAGVGTASASVNSGGTFNYSVTNPGNGCQATGTVSVIQNTTAPTVTATASGSLNCLVTSTTIVASTTTSPASYTWTGSGITGGANMASATINAGGTYNYTVTNPGNGCQATGIVAVTQNNTIPVVSASASGSINCTTSTVQTIATTTTTPVSYSWTGSGILSGANTASATVNAGGNYGYTVTNTFNQCIATGTVNVLQSAGVPSVTASSGSLNCNITSTTVIASTTATPVSYTWTGPGITSGANTATATINLGGNYIYTVTNTSNSCTATGTVSVIQNTTTPSPTASTTGTITCSTTTVNLIGGPSSLTYTWTAPAGSSVASANLATTTATGGGTYTLSVTNPSTSCSGSITLVVPTQTTNPTANIINNPSITCTNTLVMINGSPSSGVSYTWTGTGISGSANNANVNVTTTGVYTLAVTSTSNGCTSAPATVTISANTVSPSITMGSNPTIPCLPPTVQITSTVSPGTATVNWTGPNVCGGANSPTASACTPGIYTLTATNPANGCSSVSTLTVDPNSGLNVNVANTGTVYCSPSTVQVVASATPATNNTYSWSGPGIVSGNGTSSVTVNQGGTYSVVVTNTPSGCSFSYSNTVQADNTPLNIAATTNSVDCITTSANITTTVTPASGSLTYSWSNGASTQGISVSPTVSTNYIVTVTNTANGCTGSQTVNVIADTNPPTGVSVGPNNFTLTCLNTSTVLTGAATGAATYSWSSSVGSFTSPSTPTLNVTSAGTYTFIAIGANGCFATDVATVSPNSSAPVFSLTNSSPTITCGPAPTVSIVVTSTAPVSYSWSPASGIAGSNTLSTVTFTAAGTYTADVTDNNGCASSSVISVASATNPPTLSAGTDTAQPITCTNTITTLSPLFTPSADLTYTWTGSGIVGSAFTNPVQVNQSGNYSVTVTNSVTGCSTSATIAVTGSTVIPTLTVTSSSSIGISCQPGTNTVSLNAQTGGSVTYTWSTGDNTSGITSSVSGTYTITVSDINSGCTTSASIVIPDNSIPPLVNVSSAGNLPCGAGTTTSLSALSSNTNVSYSWSGAGVVSGSLSSTAIINLPGLYSVTVIDLITGCSATNTLSIVQLSLSAIAAADATTGTAPLNVNFTNQGTGATTYTWSFGDGNSSFSFNTSYTYVNTGTYTVVFNASNGSCVSSDTLLIKVLESLGEIPEIFTPNGDGKNDVFFISGLDSYPGSDLQVFNRWGNLVYSSKPYKNDWDGSPNAAGKTGSGKLPGGTYYYLLELGDANNTVFKGYVQLQY